MWICSKNVRRCRPCTDPKKAPARARRKYIPTPERTKKGATPKPNGIMLLEEDEDEDGGDPSTVAVETRG
jgi:hypothetical protein